MKPFQLCFYTYRGRVGMGSSYIGWEADVLDTVCPSVSVASGSWAKLQFALSILIFQFQIWYGAPMPLSASLLIFDFRRKTLFCVQFLHKNYNLDHGSSISSFNFVSLWKLHRYLKDSDKKLRISLYYPTMHNKTLSSSRTMHIIRLPN